MLINDQLDSIAVVYKGNVLFSMFTAAHYRRPVNQGSFPLQIWQCYDNNLALVNCNTICTGTSCASACQPLECPVKLRLICVFSVFMLAKETPMSTAECVAHCALICTERSHPCSMHSWAVELYCHTACRCQNADCSQTILIPSS